ncbi:MAG: tetratricopeptide repeat protein, partial [Acidobacteriota bacterium]
MSSNVSRPDRAPRVLLLSIALSLLACLVLASTALAAGSKKKEAPTNEAETVYNEGVGHLEAGSWGQAEAAFQQAVDLDPTSAQAHNNLGYVLRKQGAEHYAEALRHYDRALELDPKLAQAYHYRGVLHALAGKESLAKQDHARLVDLDRELA